MLSNTWFTVVVQRTRPSIASSSFIGYAMCFKRYPAHRGTHIAMYTSLHCLLALTESVLRAPRVALSSCRSGCSRLAHVPRHWNSVPSSNPELLAAAACCLCGTAEVRGDHRARGEGDDGAFRWRLSVVACHAERKENLDFWKNNKIKSRRITPGPSFTIHLCATWRELWKTIWCSNAHCTTQTLGFADRMYFHGSEHEKVKIKVRWDTSLGISGKTVSYYVTIEPDDKLHCHK